MAMTVVLPAPVASLKPKRSSSGLASWLAASSLSRRSFPVLVRGATSVIQMRVSTASTWQKKGRRPSQSFRLQCLSSRTVCGVTPHLLGSGCSRQLATSLLMASMLSAVS